MPPRVDHAVIRAQAVLAQKAAAGVVAMCDEITDKPSRRRASGIEVIVVPSRLHAERMGLRGGRLWRNPDVRVWWPGLGLHRVMTISIWRVTISRETRDHTDEGSLRSILRARQGVWGETAVWVEF